MKTFNRKIASVLLSAFVFTAAAQPASADSNAEMSSSRLEQLEQNRTALKTLIESIEDFKIAESYCKPVHRNDKSTDRGAIEHLYRLGSQRVSNNNRLRAWLTKWATNNKFVFNALQNQVPGGASSIVNGSYFKEDSNLRRMLSEARKAKIAELDSAPTRACSSTAAKPEPVFVAVNPLTEISLTTDYDKAVFITLPNKFCHKDEKEDWYDAIDRQRENAQKNEAAAERLRDRLRQQKADIAAKRQQTWKAADAAAKAGKTAALNNHTSQLKLYDAALKKIDSAIKTAIADIAKWKTLDLQLQSQREALTAAPIIDCLKADISPLDTLTISGYDGLPESIPAVTLEGMELKDVEFIKIPESVCEEEMKRSVEMNADRQNSNAYTNASRWSDRLEKIRVELLRLDNAGKSSSDLYKKLTFARREAREEHAKWEKIKLKTQEIVEKAYALKVIDCSQAGGKTEIGRMDPGFEEIADHIHKPDLQEYDLPKIPAKICSWEELQSLRARAAKAREVSAHNRQEWGKRLTQLGKLLFNGQPGSAYPMNAEYAAYLDAQRQYDYWSAQQGVSHKVYWDLMQRKSEDCTKADKKVSLNDALQNARNDAPAFASGQNSGFGNFGDASFERDCIIRNGGCFYPDPRKDWMFDRSGNQGGFDGSEAEHALNRTLDGVEVKQKHDDDEYYQQPVDHPKPQHKSAINSKTPAGGKKDAPLIEKMPDVVKTPVKSGPIPVPYPNVSMASDTSKGSTKVKVGSSSEKAPPVETPNQPVKRVNVQTPETLNKRNVTLAPSAGGQMTAVQAPPLVLNKTATSAQNTGRTGGYSGAENGGMIQIAPPPRVYVPHTSAQSTDGQFVQTAPPTLVITPQGGSAADLNAAELEQAQEGQN